MYRFNMETLYELSSEQTQSWHEDIMIQNDFRIIGPFVRGIHRSTVDPLAKGQ